MEVHKLPSVEFYGIKHIVRIDNLIGSGRSGKVYRVAANGSSFVAVKRKWNSRELDQKLEKEFLAEVEI
uniref:Protein kinase domain-containing protein n=2 Tax=Salix TaxID=40685 RepID=A0A6N2MR58_SALVM